MITPSQIKEKIISTSSHGYDIDETNAFLDEIAESYAAIYAENKELYRKMEILASKIEEYRDEEDSIKSALITAQKTADQLTRSAKEKAEALISDSAASAQQTVVHAKEKAEKLVSEARDYASNLTKEKTEAANEIIGEAEKKANDAINGAKVVAGDILAQAKEISGELVAKAKEEKVYHENLVSKLKEESNSFKANLISLYEAQLAKLTEMMEAPVDAEKNETDEKLKSVEEDINNIFSEMDGLELSVSDSAEPEKEAGEEPAEPDDTAAEAAENSEAAGQADEADSDAFELTEVNSEEDGSETETEETEEIEEIEEVTPEEVHSALDAFSKDEITPVSDEVPIAEISEEPEMEQIENHDSELPFESFFNVKHSEGRTNEKISLIPPDDYEEEEENLKFRGFFKKKKDKNK